MPGPKPRTWLPLLGLLLTVLIWAGNNIVSKIILLEASPILVALVRFTLAGLLFYLPVFLTLHRGEQRFARGDWPRLLLLGTVGVAGSLLLHLLGLRTTPATDAAIYSLMTPLFVLVLARLWFGERLNRVRMLGIAAALLGAALLAIGGAAGLGGGDLQGPLFLLSGSLVWSGYTVLSKEVLARRSPLLVLAAANLGAMAVIWPLAGLLGVWAELPRVLSWSPAAWGVMAYLVILMSMTSQWLYVRSLRDLRTSQVSALLYTQPLFTALMAAAVLGELPTSVTVVAGLLILAGVWLVNRPMPARRPPTGVAAASSGDPATSATATSG
ncbi:MAG: DMT family transporter [Chloroflexi bacterium]|nr:DMT family transporter [Chloroflexota bacterium]